MKSPFLLLLLLPTISLACGTPPDSNSTRTSTPTTVCGVLLRQIGEIAPKVTPETCVLQARYDSRPHPPPAPSMPSTPGAPLPPPPPPPLGDALDSPDPAYCRLVDPKAKVDVCLAASITDTSPRSEPFCPPMRGSIAIGDLAFLLLSDRHPGLWESVLGSNMETNAYFRSMNAPGRRTWVQRRTLRWLHDHGIGKRARSN